MLQIGDSSYDILNKDEITKQNTKKSNWECHIKSIGGFASNTLRVIIPYQKTPFIIQFGKLTESVNDELSRLIDVY